MGEEGPQSISIYRANPVHFGHLHVSAQSCLLLHKWMLECAARRIDLSCYSVTGMHKHFHLKKQANSLCSSVTLFSVLPDTVM